PRARPGLGACRALAPSLKIGRMKPLATALAALAAAAFAVADDTPQPLSLGSQAPAFDLPGVDGRNWTLADFGDSELLLAIFTCNHGPTAQYYEERIKAIAADYPDAQLGVVAISPND